MGEHWLGFWNKEKLWTVFCKAFVINDKLFCKLYVLWNSVVNIFWILKKNTL